MSESNRGEECELVELANVEIGHNQKIVGLVGENSDPYYIKLTARHLHPGQYVEEMILGLRGGGNPEKAEELCSAYNSAASAVNLPQIDI